ncbi:MAG: hypothetical protein ACFFEA_09980 [Candidatus Thorarchaeota archaeon]
MPPVAAPLEAKGPGGSCIGSNEMRRMSNENPAIVPPVLLETYEDFVTFASNAALVMYHPEYFHSPFLDDQKRLRRMTLTALGVKMNGVALTFKYVLTHDDLCDPSGTWEEQTAQANQAMEEIMSKLGAQGNLVRGSLDIEPTFGEALVLRP